MEADVVAPGVVGGGAVAATLAVGGQAWFRGTRAAQMARKVVVC